MERYNRRSYTKYGQNTTELSATVYRRYALTKVIMLKTLAYTTNYNSNGRLESTEKKIANPWKRVRLNTEYTYVWIWY